jgi:FHA domain
MTSGSPPPKASDTRREPGFDDEELPTDIIRRDPSITAKAKLRLGMPRLNDDCDVGETTVMIKKNPLGMATAALPRELRAWFEARSGPAATMGRIDVTMVRLVIGRGQQADLRIDDTMLSRQHAVVFYTGEEFRIRDENSANGTMLNGSLVVEYALRDGDEVGVGTSLLVFRAKRAP